MGYYCDESFDSLVEYIFREYASSDLSDVNLLDFFQCYGVNVDRIVERILLVNRMIPICLQYLLDNVTRLCDELCQ